MIKNVLTVIAVLTLLGGAVCCAFVVGFGYENVPDWTVAWALFGLPATFLIAKAAE